MQPKSKKKRNWPSTVKELLLLVVSIALIYWVFAPEKDFIFYPVTMADLKGVWTASDPKYQDRFLQFDDGIITFGWGADGKGSYTITEIECEPNRDRTPGTLVHISYQDLAALAHQFNFYYMDIDGGLLWMKNQKGVKWSHINDQPIHPPQFQ
jgi:hypothetical protein